ncbi:hypothetical protein like AT5G25820 [Hibiscus trionum]|uniref:Exostosin GT47 domain-containing protein n=1 Tax=Hibiscus trionum TaxID=183268 RepID=A0A9W7J5B7_HIBTR|nr:hypothetical protein like AT5G25820 [Hibiscus trionum]
MDGSFRQLCQAQSRRLLLLMAVTLALVVAVQYFELPYTKVFTSLYGTTKNGSFPTGRSSSKSWMVDNVTLSNGFHSKHTENGAEVSNIGEQTVRGNESDNHISSNTSSVLENGDNVVNGPAPDGASEQQNVTKDHNPSYGSGSFVDHLAPSAFPPMDSQSVPRDTKLRSSNSSMNTSPAPAPAPADVYLKGKKGSEKPKHKSKMQPKVVVSISEMNDLLLQSLASPHAGASTWSSNVQQEVISAKSQIMHALDTKDDSGLYPSLYRNVSMFKRSYELMESMLKVYIYKEGEKPIFHQGILEGIYASEGWFIKLMEANKRFVTEDPEKAHLFFLPFSSRLLELTLYVPKSHSRSNLIEYMRNYVDTIAAKHPFWNRSNGSDHFVVACHDWAPAETRGHLLNSIRALCNADIEVGFTIGKDVSLPETYVLSAKDPLKTKGGNPTSERHILAFFAGQIHGYVRPILLNHWGKDPDMKIFGPMPQIKGNKNYINHMKSSKFCICARGFEVNSPRVVEAIFYECVPVIISDNFVPPFFEILNWESFAVFVLEKDIPNLKSILVSISEERYMEMHKRVKMVQQHFLWHSEPVKYDLFHMILHSIWYTRVFQVRTA